MDVIAVKMKINEIILDDTPTIHGSARNNATQPEQIEYNLKTDFDRQKGVPTSVIISPTTALY